MRERCFYMIFRSTVASIDIWRLFAELVISSSSFKLFISLYRGNATKNSSSSIIIPPIYFIAILKDGVSFLFLRDRSFITDKIIINKHDYDIFMFEPCKIHSRMTH